MLLTSSSFFCVWLALFPAFHAYMVGKYASLLISQTCRWLLVVLAAKYMPRSLWLRR
jgi:hypothetical protein